MGCQRFKVSLLLHLCGTFHRSLVPPAWTKAGRQFSILQTKLVELTIVHINIMIFHREFHIQNGGKLQISDNILLFWANLE